MAPQAAASKEPIKEKTPRVDGAELLRRTFDFEVFACVVTGDPQRGARVAARIEAGRVLVNTLTHEPKAPFGGFKQSGIGRENGPYGLEAYLEPKALMVAV
ncbi:aldehyde dehydrogenase family protein [Archangium violaceum]|uniref:aldehyde dehydrogenase family protein n=1 Tax=Archangium violaceum TaxID=83451 RepID=UPI0037BF90A2